LKNYSDWYSASKIVKGDVIPDVPSIDVRTMLKKKNSDIFDKIKIESMKMDTNLDAEHKKYKSELKDMKSLFAGKVP